MDPADSYKLDSAVKEIDKGWLVGILVFAIRVFVIFIVAFSRAVAVVATDKIPENLFDQPFPLPSTILEQVMPGGFGSLMTPATPPKHITLVCHIATMYQVGNIYIIAAVAVVGGGLFGMPSVCAHNGGRACADGSMQVSISRP